MPFKETCPMEERIVMLREYDSGLFTDSELAHRFGISRTTFYDWLGRRDTGDPDWFQDRSCAPKHCPHRTSREKIEPIIALRRRFPQWGPKKIRARLMRDQPDSIWPATSTIGDILKREGLIEPRERRRKRIDKGDIIAGAIEPNGEWSVDFKGWFRTLDGSRCDPLTIVDTWSRYLIELHIVKPTMKGVQSAMKGVFKDYGLPKAIRSDNGTPFGAAGAGGLSRLSVWWLKLGIEPRYIPPASPQHNGRHERMHRTLKAETSTPPARCAQEQQKRFDGFRRYYNEERPHEALAQKLPSDHWERSKRSFDGAEREPWYDADHEVRRVRSNGQIRWRGKKLFIGQAFWGEPLGLVELESGGHLVRYFDRDLGVIGPDFCFHSFAPPRTRLRFAMETKGE